MLWTFQGYWVDRNIRQFSSKCNDNAVWEPPLEGATCKRISCLDPQEKNYTRRTLQDLTAGSKLVLKIPIYFKRVFNKAVNSLQQAKQNISKIARKLILTGLNFTSKQEIIPSSTFSLCLLPEFHIHAIHCTGLQFSPALHSPTPSTGSCYHNMF